MSPENRSSAEPATRIAIVGAPTPEGAHVREALERARVPGSLVDMYGDSDGEALLGEYAGEARLIQETDPAEIAGTTVVLLCERGSGADRVIEASAAGQTLIDVVGAVPEDVPTTLVRPDLEEGIPTGGFLSVPHPLTLVLYDLLRPLDRGPGVDEAVAVVLRPAADYGEAGVEELRKQTVHLLNFIEMPVDTFGRQLAFNIVPDLALSCAVPGLDGEIAKQVARMLGWDRERLTLRFLAAPLFYGHGIELRLRTSNGAGLDDVRRVLAESGLTPGQDGGPMISTPLEVADERAIRLGEVSADGLGGFWLWAVAGRSASRAAEIAADLARRAIGG